MEPWVLYAFGAMGGFFFFNFLSRFVGGENQFLVSIVLYISAAIGAFVVFRSTGGDVSFHSRWSPLVAILLGLASLGGTVCLIKAIGYAPNPGYASAISVTYVPLLAIVSYFIFGSPLGTQQLLGIAAVLIGVWLLST